MSHPPALPGERVIRPRWPSFSPGGAEARLGLFISFVLGEN